ncbi:MAG: ParB/RepB/Spo0J family partition protein [Bacillota bacterium]|nr:ParB/RepB/Spo0J family partition protein [Bacillota bacterium]
MVDIEHEDAGLRGGMMLARDARTRERDGTERDLPRIVPQGTLLRLSVDQVKPNPKNPRKLFDPKPLSELRESIRTHGVLVPITVYKLPGQDKYAIVDGERRHRCCVDLRKEGLDIDIPANVVEPPGKMASLLYMFNIHAFREQWELMPTALSLQEVMDELHTEHNGELHEVTGLSIPQIERCKKILGFPKSFQQLSLDPDPSKRVPSNFWVELYPVLEEAPDLIPDLYDELGRDGITQAMVEKYRSKKVKSVIHFRRIVEAIEIAEHEEARQAVADRLREYVLTPELETREAFDGFIRDTRKVQRAVGACDKFISDLKRAKVQYTIEDKEQIVAKLLEVIEFTQRLLDRLQGDEPPEEAEDTTETSSTAA